MIATPVATAGTFDSQGQAAPCVEIESSRPEGYGNDASDTIATAEIISLADGVEPESWLTDRLRLVESAPLVREPRDGVLDAWRENGPDALPVLARLAALRGELPLLAPRDAL